MISDVLAQKLMKFTLLKLKPVGQRRVSALAFGLMTIGFPGSSFSNPSAGVEAERRTAETFNLTGDDAGLLQLKPSGAKAAQAAARGAIAPNEPSRAVAAAVSAGTFAASVRGDGGGTAGGLEKTLNP